MADKADKSRELALSIAGLMADKKAEDLVVLDMRELVTYTDYLVIATGRNERQVKAIFDQVYGSLKHGTEEILPAGTEGTVEGRWVLIDYGEVVVHIFTPVTRSFYRLERLWGEAPVVEVADLVSS